VHGEALWHVLRFDENRVRFYLTSTVEHLQSCIDDYDRKYETKSLGKSRPASTFLRTETYLGILVGPAAEASKFRRQLSELTRLVRIADDRTLDERACTSLETVTIQTNH
jgi:hypothetical protein